MPITSSVASVWRRAARLRHTHNVRYLFSPGVQTRAVDLNIVSLFWHLFGTWNNQQTGARQLRDWKHDRVGSWRNWIMQFGNGKIGFFHQEWFRKKKHIFAELWTDDSTFESSSSFNNRHSRAANSWWCQQLVRKDLSRSTFES